MIRTKKRVLIVLLHGSEETAHDLQTFFHRAPLESFGDIPFVQVAGVLGIDIAIPSADERPFDPSNEELKNVWFNKSRGWPQLGMDDDFEDVHGLNASIQKISEFLRDVQCDYDFIFLGGFDMGGTLSLHMIFHQLHEKVAGIFSIGSYITRSVTTIPPCPSEELEESLSTSYLPVLMMHGIDDNDVPIEWGTETASSLVLRGVEVKFLQYSDAEHEISEEQLHSLLDWMEGILNAKLGLDVEGGGAGGAGESKEGSLSMDPQVHIPRGLPKEDTTQDPSNAFHMTMVPGSADTWCITYPTDPEMVIALAGRPVLCNGGMFDITPAPNGKGVQCIISSSDPEKTAVAIGERLVNRIRSTSDGTGDIGADVCAVS